MTSYHDLKTKKARIEYIKHQIETNDKWLLKGLIAIYDRQTADEKTMKATIEFNGVGFNGVDSEILSSFAQFYKRAHFLTDAQLRIARKKMVKYAKQLDQIAQSKGQSPQRDLMG